MKAPIKSFLVFPAILLTGITLCSFLTHEKDKDKFPYKQAGLTDRQAAAHLLNRFTYGASPGEIDEVVKMGPENWFYQQLAANLPDDALNQRLKAYDAINLSNMEVGKIYPKTAQVLKMGVQAGIINKDSVKTQNQDKKEYRAQILEVMQKQGMKPQQELFRQFFNQKILRATYTNNQMQEIMTDFWFNHFNVSLTKNDCAEYIPAYERDVIRPNVFGKFSNLLVATAKSPAMLFYLDNFSSQSAQPAQARPVQGQLRQRLLQQARSQGVIADSMNSPMLKQLQQGRKAQGLNENYAREVMELHTLGVDGGYTQQDVTQAAKVLTGWTVNPSTIGGQNGGGIQRLMTAANGRMKQQGFVNEGDFLFAANRHDNTEKTVLGRKFPANGGYEEGVQLLEMLAHHASTAHFISNKLAVRFVNDTPPESLVSKMAKTFSEKDGDIREVLITMVSSPEFWSKDALREKTKSPFELAISSVRALHADINQPQQIFNWVTKMGQKMYYYQAPTGFPDKGQYWINTGSLLNRMNFGLALASQRIPGVNFSLAALNNNHEPESASAALLTYSKYLLPERDVAETVKRLTPMMNDPELGKKIDDAAGKNAPPADQMDATGNTMTAMADNPANGKNARQQQRPNAQAGGGRRAGDVQYANGNNTMLAQVVGVIIGSPEFQRK